MDVSRKSTSRCRICTSEISDESSWQAELNASGLKKIGGKVAELEADESKIVPSKKLQVSDLVLASYCGAKLRRLTV